MILGFKFAGAICVLLASIYLGYSINQTMDERNTQLRKLYSLLLQLKSEMNYRGTTLPEWFHMMEQENLKFKAWFAYLSEGLEQQEGNFDEVWRESLKVLYDTTALKKEDIDLISELSDKLTNADLEGLTKNIDYVLLQIERNRLSLETDIKQKKKVVTTLALFVGIMTVIVLI